MMYVWSSKRLEEVLPGAAIGLARIGVARFPADREKVQDEFYCNPRIPEATPRAGRLNACTSLVASLCETTRSSLE
jgi:hypothetical protein